MARIARVVVPSLPHHVTQRGNRREPVFFEADDYRLYRRLVAEAARRAGTAVWAYCLMPDHVNLALMPTWRGAGGRGWVAGDLFRGASALHRGHQRPVPVQGRSVPGPLASRRVTGSTRCFVKPHGVRFRRLRGQDEREKVILQKSLKAVAGLLL